MLAMVSALDHGNDFVGINVVACQDLRDFLSQRRISANDLTSCLVMRDPETAMEDRLQSVRKRAMTDVMKQPGHGQNPGVVPG